MKQVAKFTGERRTFTAFSDKVEAVKYGGIWIDADSIHGLKTTFVVDTEIALEEGTIVPGTYYGVPRVADKHRTEEGVDVHAVSDVIFDLVLLSNGEHTSHQVMIAAPHAKTGDSIFPNADGPKGLLI